MKGSSNDTEKMHDSNRLAMENSFDSRELANTLLSLGSNKQTIDDTLKQNFTSNDSFSKRRYIPMPPTSISNFESASEVPSYSNGWIGNSALLGFPYSSYQVNHFPICSCIPRVSPEYPGWKPYQQNTLTSFAAFNPNGHQNQGFRYPQPLHHPLLFAQGPLQSSLPNYNSLEGKYMTDIPTVRMQGHNDQYTIAFKQHQMLSVNSAKFETERAGNSLKQENTDEPSLAVVAPVLVDFGQKNKVKGIPLLCNVSQWLNLPSYDRNKLAVGHFNKSAQNSGESEQANSKTALESLISLKLRKDPISQLGEAANLILQSEEMKGNESQSKQQIYDSGLESIGIQGYSSSMNMCEKDFDYPSNATSRSSCNLTEPSTFDDISRMKIPNAKSLKNRTCPYCKKIFARPFTLKSHIRRHTKEKPYTCAVCQRSFSQSATLENHKLTHTGVKPHQCHLCLKRFAHQTSLKTHLRIHSGEQPYKCELCERRFTDGSTLQKHKRTHSGDKPFQCQCCLKCFSQSGNMKRHMAATHKNALQMKDSCSSTKDLDTCLSVRSDENISI